MILLPSLILVGIFLFLTAFFAGAETGFVSLDLHHLKHLAQNNSAKAERSLLKIAKQPERFLALTLIGINMSIVISTSILTNIFEKYSPSWISLGTLITSLFIFFCCEVLPKMAFSSRPLELSLKALPLIELFDRILSLPIAGITSVTRFVMGLVGLRSERKKRRITRDELLILLGMGNSSGVLTDRPHRMAKGIIGLKDTRICEIMVPRVRIVAIDVNSSLKKAQSLFIESGYSRIPVFEGGIDQIVGTLYFKDLFLKNQEGKTLRDFLGKAAFVPEVKNAYELFREMLSRNFQTAIVFDEYGATAGLVTLEDLMEEVVGEIQDELDEPTSRIKFHDDGSMSVKADLNFATLQEEAGITFDHTEGISTLNGLILERLGRIPVTGESIVIDGHRLEVAQADQKKIVSVKFLPEPDSSDGGNGRSEFGPRGNYGNNQ